MKHSKALLNAYGWLGLVATGLSLSVWAQAPAEVPNTFDVSAQQIESLGIQIWPLQAQTEAVRIHVPAQVVVPVEAEQVVTAPVAGLITQVLVQPYQAVAANAPLLRIVSPELGQLQLQLLQAGSQRLLAQQTNQREQQLYKEGITPQRRTQEAQATLKTTEAALNQAKMALRLAGLSSATIEQILASGKPQESLTVLATQSGIVTDLPARPGQRVDVATALVHLTQTDSLWLDIQLPASERMNWPSGTWVDISGYNLRAQITQLSPSVTASSQTLSLRARIEGHPTTLRPGELVSVELPAQTAQSGWDVPLSAVAYNGQQAYVFVRKTNGFEVRPVTLLASAGPWVRVQGTFSAGEAIATTGIIALKGAWLEDRGTP